MQLGQKFTKEVLSQWISVISSGIGLAGFPVIRSGGLRDIIKLNSVVPWIDVPKHFLVYLWEHKLVPVSLILCNVVLKYEDCSVEPHHLAVGLEIMPLM